MKSILIIILSISFFLGQVIRIPLFKSVDITFLDISVCMIGIYTIFYSFFKKDSSFKKYPLSIPIGLFLLTGIFSLLLSFFNYTFSEVFVGSLYLIRWLLYSSVYFFIAKMGNKHKLFAIKGLSFSATGIVIVGLFQYIFYPNLKNLYYLQWDDHLYRIFSTYFDPNFIAAIISLFLYLLLLIIIKKRQSYLNKLIYASIFVLSFIALLFTYSRSGYLMFYIGMLIILWLLNQKRYIIYLSLFLLFGILLIPKNLGSAGIELWRSASIFARSISAQQAITIFADHPIMGVGFDNYRYALRDYNFAYDKNWEVSHSGGGTDNSFLFILATTGIIGFVFYINLLWNIAKKAWFFYKTKKIETSEYNMAILLFASLISVIFNSFFINSLFYPAIMVWLWVLVGVLETGKED